MPYRGYFRWHASEREQGIREYLISPTLSLRSEMIRGRSEKSLGKLPASLNEMKMEKMVDSTLSGLLSGGILSGIVRGKQTIPRAALTASLLAGILQYGTNQSRIIRLRYLASRQSDHDHSLEHASSPIDTASTSPTSSSSSQTSLNPVVPKESSSSSHLTGTQGETNWDLTNTRMDMTKSDPKLPGRTMRESMADPLAKDKSDTLPTKILSSLSSFLPIRQLSNEAYLETLQRKRSEVDKRLKEIEEEELRIFESSK
ncbi:hypothetical protein TREMEDRAFT_59839 [Tremella mesenterica DSM 1558]|uniref:uncharacterized protein n=1 Tax=Tremella mesenterica (strain ATCC 24925 / CBS 8224 / DSM 1558 / NBRC 9311 / NRRL Y-6157 / RJB 2259-6 / UBC 559-6) TaxID=578456 RepID=UPI0003F48FB9|nr:uncharacterized protein TREMEDRAFT_59839 [Tremella mesenterica DSM 1558]EIW73666.1 hypothetical protein TREMEDRAFT_59839 [Tremella mesenterica DSM 1558]